MDFEWDENKNQINQKKHGVSFDEAKTVFYDPAALLEYDAVHSDGGERFRLLGCSSEGNVLLVVHCIRKQSVIRIISSRKATSGERKHYERGLMSDFERDEFLEKEFDFSKAIKNPYAKMFKKEVTISLDENVFSYFQKQSDNAGIPYQALISLYLRDCMTNKRKLEVTWKG